ncbi:DNA methyltransferase [Mahella australiensis]|uniref:DNA methylase N-4/N-6 domain protein n=1 Tax=Mahella australiensis (strain DSM 15567 / CIP 107919 / 50-1 BON) TaxID=697281 RepID=F3ZW07_MAHA5|nr:DNA methylase N-4/N-6 domain protein [Mahella australiensis 50-1 BON]
MINISTYEHTDLMTVKEASDWAAQYLNKKVTESNILYLIQYGKIKKISQNGSVLVSRYELENYYESYYGRKEVDWKNKLGEDLNWALSFEHVKEAETTKHVHRLHPYKGKFIPQLVEYFLDDHTDDFKKETYFRKGDIVLDPFCGSGTTLVQCNELDMHAIGIDVSAFNALISNVKVLKYDLTDVFVETQNITKALDRFSAELKITEFEEELQNKLSEFNDRYFPSPDFKYWISEGKIREDEYSKQKAMEFMIIYNELVNKYGIKLTQDKSDTFLDKWYLENVRKEIDYVFSLIKGIKNINTKKIISIILSRTIRSCRATTHSDLATLKEPVISTYYCTKHKKLCKPIFSIKNWWQRYSKDTIKRLTDFDKIRTRTFQICLTGDSRTIDIVRELENKNKLFAEMVSKQKISGIFSSPPYVGLIDYHEQHAYAYDLFGFARKDELEIGPLYKGQNKEARESYIEGIAQVLNNCKRFMVKDYNVFLVANDKYNLYPTIAEQAGMKIVNQYKRPVLNRTERDKGAYSEIIFHLKENS